MNFGIVYGISSFGLSQDLSISRKEAADYIEKYFHTYPKIKEFLDRTVEQARKRRICDDPVRPPHGRCRSCASGNYHAAVFRGAGWP